jgi:hypothetical protein
MITGAHAIVYSMSPGDDRDFFRKVLGFPSVDAGNGWLIFGLPPAEVAVHPSEENDVHELYLMCDDVEAFVAAMGRRKVRCGPIQDEPWGRLTQLTLPGGGKLGVYEPRHASPKHPRVAKRRAAPKAKPRARASRAPKKRTTRRR